MYIVKLTCLKSEQTGLQNDVESHRGLGIWVQRASASGAMETVPWRAWPIEVIDSDKR